MNGGTVDSEMNKGGRKAHPGSPGRFFCRFAGQEQKQKYGPGTAAFPIINRENIKQSGTKEEITQEEDIL